MSKTALGPILAVEDNPDDLFLLESAIDKADLRGQVRIVRDGMEAIAYLGGDGPCADRTSFPMPSLVLLDLKLPKKSGMDVLTWMQERPESDRIPVIVLSASSSETDVRKAYDLGAVSYHVKSIGFDVLFALVRDIHRCQTSQPASVPDCLLSLPGARLRP